MAEEVVLYEPSGRRVQARPPSMEIAKVEWGWMRKYGGWETNPDPVIRQKGSDKVIEYERDTHLQAQLYTRKQNLISKGWRIVPPWNRRYTPKENGMEAADPKMPEKIALMNWILDEKLDNFAHDLMGIMDAYGKGFSLSEKVWERVRRGRFKGYWAVKGIHRKPWKNFQFKRDEFGHVEYAVNIADNNARIKLDNFIHCVFGPDDENPYGEGLTSLCAFYVWLKKNQIKFWAIFGEKFSMPITLAKVPKGLSEDKAALSKIDDFLDNLQSETGFRIPEGFEVEFLEAMRRSEVTYDNFIERCNKEISKLVLGQTLTSEEGKRGQGSYALGQAHLSILDIYVFFDMLLIEAVINRQLIRPIMDFNYFDGVYPYFEFVNAINWSVFAQAVFNLVNAGVKLPASWVYRTANIPEPGPDDEVIEQTSGNGVNDDGTDNQSFALGAPMPKPGRMMQSKTKSFTDQVNDVLFATIEVSISDLKQQISAIDAIDIENMPQYAVNVSEIKKFLVKQAIFKQKRRVGRFLSTEEWQKMAEFYENDAFKVAGIAKTLIEYEINSTILAAKSDWSWADFREDLGKRLVKIAPKFHELFTNWLENIETVEVENEKTDLDDPFFSD